MTNIRIRRITSKKDLNKSIHIRTVVFIKEQNVPRHEEIDGRDGEADHYLLSVDDLPMATARVRYASHVAKIERVAVLKPMRGRAIGRRLMEFIMADIRKNPAVRIIKLGAQIQAVEFYEKLGFTGCGDQYLDAGIGHRQMKQKISKIRF